MSATVLKPLAQLCKTVAALGLLAPFTAVVPTPALASDLTTGRICDSVASTCNRCIENVPDAVNALRDHGDPLGFFTIGDPVGNAASNRHWQGVQRLHGAGKAYLAISRSNGSNNTVPFSVVHMGAENDTGGRWRSNKLSHSSYPATAPDASAQMIADEAMPAGLAFKHSGGLQSSGDILAVALDGSLAGTSNGRVLFYNVGQPTSRVLYPPRITTQTSEAGSVGITQLQNETFLVVTARSGANTLEFYRSNSANLSQATTTFSFVDTWSEGELQQSTINDWEFGDYQSLQFITQCDGSLFLAGTHMNTSVVIGIGQDWLDLFRVTDSAGQITLTKVAKKHLYCGYPSPGYGTGDNTHCNLDAAGGVYVDSNGKLIVYGVEHDNSGPSSTVKMMEFRSIFPNSSQCTSDIQQAFIELYDDSDFSDRGLMIDYADYSKRRYDDLKKVEGFGDKTSAVRWCVPNGWRARIYQHDTFGGSYKEFTGMGSQNLNDIGFGDKTSSVRFVYVGG